MKEEELVENRLAIELSRGTILDEYLIKFLKSNGSNHFVEEIENSSKLIKELEEILFLLDLDVTDLMRIRDDLRRSLQKIEDNIFSLELPKQDIEKLMSDISQWRENDEKLLSDISSLRKKEEKLMFEEENKQKRLNVEKNRIRFSKDYLESLGYYY